MRKIEVEAGAAALDNLARIGRGLTFERFELREAAKAVLRAAEAARKRMRRYKPRGPVSRFR